ncbi:MAG TPA: thiamine-phosphate kinase [Bacteroidales bacterium]|nr:thiamine-phosphate kinase [Bacteroidales bacterium]
MSIENENIKRTELSELGEFGLIERLTKDLTLHNQSTIKGVGDDAAVMQYDNHSLILLTNDILIEGVHFDLTYTPLKHLGYKAGVVNFSDIYAMNGIPRQLVVGLGVSNRFSVEALDEFYEGLRLACQHYGVDLVGGDTSSSKAGMFISISVVGEVSKDEVVYRNGAQLNDLICVTGDLGAAYMGLLLLEREKQVYLANPNMQPELKGNDYVLERQLKPEARKDIIRLLHEANIKPTAMIDISDGLASDILHICEQSNKGCVIYEDKIPIDPATLILCDEFKIIPTIAALHGGEDYELLFTVSLSEYSKIEEIQDISLIGHITDPSEGCQLITNDGKQIALQAQGWNHLRK